jgi:hypothetical protein
MKHDKNHYISLTLPKDYGFDWVYYDHADKLHVFQKDVTYTPAISQEQIDDGWKPVTEKRYVMVRCRESEIDDGSLALLFKLGMTR